MPVPLETVYTHGKLILSIVARGLGEKLVSITKKSGARGGTILMGTGVGESSLLSLLGLGDADKDIVFTLTTNDESDATLEGLRHCKLQEKRKAGICMLIDVPHILKHVVPGSFVLPEQQRSPTMEKPDHTLIVLIINKGYAEDAMEAARRAGATGGTILTARGTGKEEDVKFFGINLVPEKEMLLIVADEDNSDRILEAVRSVECLKEPGSGIVFCIDVERFITLGKQ